ncbi:Protein of unknown function [Gryllus bimaculatus]|nr:Protein of unknown function [Gryllus bimaculatus]
MSSSEAVAEGWHTEFESRRFRPMSSWANAGKVSQATGEEPGALSFVTVCHSGHPGLGYDQIIVAGNLSNDQRK